MNLRGLQSWGLDQKQVGVASQSSEEPQEWLFVLVVRLGRNVVILQVPLAVEGDLAGLHFSVLNVDLGLKLDSNFTLFPTKTIGTFSQILVKSLCHLGTFL